MEREEAFEFLSKEVRRLIEEEHVNDLFKANCAEELAAVDCRTTKAISDFFIYNDEGISLKDEEIAEGNCAAIVLWATSSCAFNEQLFEDVGSFAHRLASEGDAGVYGKNIAFQMLDGVELYDISKENFFSDKYAKAYDAKYGNDAE